MRHLTLLMLCWACKGAAGHPDLVQDIAVEQDYTDAEEVSVGPRSFYRLEVTYDDGKHVILGRDLTDRPSIYAFGSTHIAPAVSFAMTDTVYDPYVIVTFNLGIVVGSMDHPVQCPGPGIYKFGTGSPPEMDLFANNLQFRSRLPGAEGTFEVTRWSVTTGDTVAGHVKGRLVFDGATPHWADVDAEFQFELPERS